MSISNYEYGISGMTCAGCAGQIEKSLIDLPYIAKLSVNFLLSKLYVSIIDEKEENMSEIEEIIYGLDFKITFKNEVIPDENSERLISFQSQMKNEEKINMIKQNLIGIKSISKYNSLSNQSNHKEAYKTKVNQSESLYVFNIIYHPSQITSYDILNNLEKSGIDYEINSKMTIFNTIDKEDKADFNGIEFSFIIFLSFIILLLTIFIKQTFIEDFLIETYLFSKLLSLYIALLSIISFFIIYKYAIDVYISSYHSYIQSNHTGMNTLISIGSIFSLLLSIILVIKYFITESTDKVRKDLIIEIGNSLGTSALVISITTVGKYFEGKAKNYIKDQCSKLIFYEELNFKDLSYRIVKVISKSFSISDNVKTVQPDCVEKNDVVLVKSGDLVLFDSILLNGDCQINEKLNQGYDLISKVQSGAKVRSGSIIISATAKEGKAGLLLVDSVIEKSKFYKQTEMMIKSMTQKLKLEHSIDRIAYYFVPFILIISVLTMITWVFLSIYKDFFNGSISLIQNQDISVFFIVQRGISIIVISCPCAFGLAIPLVTTIMLSQSLKNGILIKNVTLLPEIIKTKAIVFDKTGTLTETIMEVRPEVEIEEKENLIYETIMKIEYSQKHPIGQALYEYSLKRLNRNYTDMKLVEILHIQSKSNGVHGEIISKGEKMNVYIGSIDYITTECDYDFQSNSNSTYEKVIEKIKKENNSISILLINKDIQAIFSINNSSYMRLESKGVIDYLKSEYNIKSYILSGDSNESVRKASQLLGISNNDSVGEAKPEEKHSFLKELLGKHGKVMMVGDGINDCLSLSVSSFGVSFNPNSQLNMLSSEVIVVKEDLSLVISLLEISFYTNLFIWINLFWAFAYNLIMIPMATGFFNEYFFEVSPQLSSFLMFLSDVMIVFNSNLLRFIKFDGFKQKDDLKTKKERRFGYERLSDSVV